MIGRLSCAVIAGVMITSWPALALEPKQCLPLADMNAALKAEGQMPVVIGNRVTTRKDRPVNIFTSDANGRGYALEGDAPHGQPSKRVCVGARYSGLRINDINSPVVPSWALIGNSRASAQADCTARKAGVCDSYDDYVRRATAGGMRVMLVARSESTQGDGSIKQGRLLTILTRPDRKIADVTATNRLGASEAVGGLEDVNYTQFAVRFIVAP